MVGRDAAGALVFLKGEISRASFGTQNVHFWAVGAAMVNKWINLSVSWLAARQNDVMRISPEPLHPMRSWRELWQSQPMLSDSSDRNPAQSQTELWKRNKRAKSGWFHHLFNRELPK